LNGILFVLRSGIPWEMLPQEMGCGSGMTCWRRLRDWQAAGIWRAFHHALLTLLGRAGIIDWSRCSLDAASLPAKGGGEDTGPNPTDRGKPGSKRHVIVDRQGIPLAALLTAANVHDSVVLEQALDDIQPIRNPRGRPRRRPAKLHADKAYDFPRCRNSVRHRKIIPRIARRGLDSSERLGRYRWVVERTLAWIARCRRLVVRYERRADIHLAFLVLACALICFRFVQRFC
jgi:transposase